MAPPENAVSGTPAGAGSDLRRIGRALISVSDKTGVGEFAAFLERAGVEILSTGGTARLLEDRGVAVTEVSTYTGLAEMLGGRVKTLHPRIHAGILGRRGEDDESLAANDIPYIDLVIVNLYPFERAVADPGCDLRTAIENIDIGGPALLRAAAKNHADVTVLVDADDYAGLRGEIEALGGVSGRSRFRLAVKAFAHTARYDGAISNFLSALGADGQRSAFPDVLTLQFRKREDLRYGENPHQRAAVYQDALGVAYGIAGAQLAQGKPLSYNNIADADTACECAQSFDEPACVIVKHANPCGVALGDDITVAYDRAYATDPTSAFGGVIAFNRRLDAHTAKTIIDRQFVEVVIAPEIDEDALLVLGEKQNVRVLRAAAVNTNPAANLDFKRITGGLLLQDRDLTVVAGPRLETMTVRTPSPQELGDLMFAWKVAKFVKSNAIVYARDGQTVGVGAGQMSRIYSARIAAIKAADEGLRVEGSVMASDAFFPFRDSIDAAHEIGITAVIQPGGSMRDEEVIAAANEHGIAMVFTAMRHFRH